MLRKITKFLTIYSIGILLMTVLLILVALIPKEAIAKNAKRSADYIAGFNGDAHYMRKDDKTSYIDDWADSIWLNMSMQLDHTHPFSSVIEAPYYSESYVIEANRKSAYGEVEANNSYGRYWNGALVIIRPLLLVMDLEGIYTLNVFILIIAIGTLLWDLYRHRRKIFALAFVIGLLCTGIYTVPYCMEYMPSILVMIAMCFGVIHVKEKHILPLFFIGGMVVNYFDFLTYETITFTIPALLYLSILYEDEKVGTIKDILIWVIKAGSLWLFGYVGTWIAKWIITYFVVGPDSLIRALNSVVHRTYTVSATNTMEQLIRAQISPFIHIFPWSLANTYGEILLVTCLVIGIIGSIVILWKKRTIHKGIKYSIYILMGIPFLRFLILNNHAYIHPFFVYRAHLILIVGIVCLLGWQCSKSGVKEEKQISNQ